MFFDEVIMQADEPTLARPDGECESSSIAPKGRADWLNNHAGTRGRILLPWKYRYFGKVGDWVNPSLQRWQEDTNSRLRRE